jgi:membrane-associated phospholipid phosphatase
MHNIDKYWIAALLALLCTPCRSQSGAIEASHAPTDSSTAQYHPVYHVNYWVSLPIIAVGGAGGLYWTSHPKPNLSDADLNAAQSNPNNVPSFDRISLHQKLSLVPQWDKYASAAQIIGAVMPLAVLIDGDVRPDWLPVLTIGLEVNMVTLGIYTITPLGPEFVDRYRPIVYYPLQEAKATGINQKDGNMRASFYSGHVASLTASAMFVAKVYSDYHPDANEFEVYGLAAIPSLGMGVIRFMTLDHFPSDIAVGLTVGTLCGVLIPQLHRVGGDGLSMGAYSSPMMGTGLTLAWTPPVMAAK